MNVGEETEGGRKSGWKGVRRIWIKTLPSGIGHKGKKWVRQAGQASVGHFIFWVVIQHE